MSEIRLERLEIQNYRSIGRLGFDVPPTGVVILSGSNGLGKSSVFEAIEWALTGDTERRKSFRLDARDARTYEGRLGADGKTVHAAAATLSFRDAGGVQQIVRAGPSGATPDEVVVNTMVRTGWDVTDRGRLGTYLHLTHLLPQSRLIQPLFQGAQEQWTSAQGLFRLNGLDGALANLQRLQRGGSRLQRRMSAIRDEATAALKEAEEWELRQTRWFDSERALAASKSRTPAEFKALALDLGTRLHVAALDLEGLDNAATVGRLRRALSDRRMSLAVRRDVLIAQEQAAARWADLKARRAALEAGIPGLATRLEEAEHASARLAETHRLRLLAEAGVRSSAADADFRMLAADESVEALSAYEALAEVLPRLRPAREAPEPLRSPAPTVGGSRSWSIEELQALAEQARVLGADPLLDPQPLAEIVSRREQATSSVEELRSRRQSLESRVDALDRDAALRREAAGQAEKLLTALIAQLRPETPDCPLCGTGFPHEREERSLLAVAQSRLGRSNPELAAAEAALREARQDLDGLAAAERAAVEEKRGAEREFEQARRLVVAALDLLAQADSLPNPSAWVEARLQVAPGSTWDIAAVELERQARILRRVQLDVDLEERRRDSAEANQASTHQTAVVGDLRVRMETERATIADLTRSLDGIQAGWSAAALPGAPSPGALTDELAAVEADVAGLADGGATDAKLRALEDAGVSIQAELSLKQTREEFERKARELGCSPLLVATTLRARAERAEERTKETQVLGGQLDALQGRLGPAVERYRDEVLRPLAPAMREWLRCLLADRAWDAFDRAGTRNDRNMIELMVQQLDHAGRGVGDARPAQQILSEGQLAAVAMARMLTWNRAFRWSRWNALLLDDPLQYSDTIHVAGLADGLRSFVEAERIQVMLSTHDIELARFFKRKFHARGVPVQGIRLEAPSADGVVWSTF